MSARVVPQPPFFPYGAPELKHSARARMVRALMTGNASWIAAYFLAIGAAALFPYREPVKVPIIVDPCTIVQPPMLPELQVPRVPIAPPKVAPRIGPPIPVPVTPPQVEETDAPPRAEPPGPVTGNGESSERPVVAPPAVEVIPKLGEPNPVDEIPVAITKPKPEYPELAREANIDGTVLVLVLVGKNGGVMDAVIDKKFSVPMLDEAALEAARRWVFKPAIMNNRPVAAWVSITMRFTLH